MQGWPQWTATGWTWRCKGGHHKMWGRRVRKYWPFFFSKCVSLYDYQSKPNRYRKKLMYLKTEQWQIKTQQIHEKQEENISITQKETIKPQKETKKTKKKYKTNKKTRFKMAINSIPINNSCLENPMDGGAW